MDTEKKTYVKEQFSGLTAIEEIYKAKSFDECEFTNCSFIGCRFERCSFLNCTFSKCDLSNLVPMNSEIRKVKFLTCKAIGIDWTRASKIIDISFTDSMLNYSNFRIMKLPKIVMKNCEAKDVDFIETDLTDGNFRKTNFEESTFFKTNLTNADFSMALNYEINPTTNTLKQTRFSMPEAMSLLNSLDIIIE